MDAWDIKASKADVKKHLKNINAAIRYNDSMGNIEKVDELMDEREIFLTFRKKNKRRWFA